MLRIMRGCACAALIALVVKGAFSQSKTWPPTYPTPTADPRESYSDYYGSTIRDYHRPPVSARQYTYDRYMYNRPTVSPYLNLLRPQGFGPRVNNYYAYVRPELERRTTAATPSVTGPGTPTTPSNNPYFNRLYSRP